MHASVGKESLLLIEQITLNEIPRPHYKITPMRSLDCNAEKNFNVTHTKQLNSIHIERPKARRYVN